MTLYDLVIFLHVAAAVGLLSGSVVGSPAVRAAVRRARTTEELRAYLAIGRLFLVLEPASALVILASGAYLTSTSGFWIFGWVQVAVALWVVNSALAGAVVKPVISRITGQATTSSDGPVGDDLNALRWSPRWAYGGDAIMANDAATLWLMMMKPGLAGSLLVVAGVNLVVAAWRATTSRRGRDATGKPASGAAPA